MLEQIALGLALAALVLANHPCCDHLDNPVLVDSLAYLEDGFETYLPTTEFTTEKWASGSIPELCKYIVDGKVYSSVVHNSNDIEVWNIKYDDCRDPWVFCHHKDSPVSIDTMAQQFGRMPIQMRQWIRHVVDLPSYGGWAFAYDGTITFNRPVENMLTTFIHEIGHVLDANAYADKPLSGSDLWGNEFDQDPNIPDNYAGSNIMEDLAQITVVAAYNELVPGGYSSIEPNWNHIFHQYATIIEEARKAGTGNSIITAGSDQECTHRLPPSDAISPSTKRGVSRSRIPDISLKSNVKELKVRQAANHGNCTLTW